MTNDEGVLGDNSSVSLWAFFINDVINLTDSDSRLAKSVGIPAVSNASMYFRTNKNYSHGAPLDALDFTR